MGKKILTFGNIEIEKNITSEDSYFYGKVLVSKKISFDEKKNYKYVIGYLYNDNKVKPLPIILPKASSYCKKLDQVNGCVF